MTRLPTREAVQRLAETAERYRQAFARVQDLLATLDLGRVPSWVFAIDRLNLDELRASHPELAEAEELRRAWRTALHALVEHIALDDEGEDVSDDYEDEAPSTEEVDRLVSGLDGGVDADHQRKLDRFISVVNFAKAGGCIYVDGGFQPVARAATTPKPAPQVLPSAPRVNMPPPPADGLPEGAHLELTDASFPALQPQD